MKGDADEKAIRFQLSPTQPVREAPQEGGDHPPGRADIEYFKDPAQETGIPYQALINLYLRECAVEGKKPAVRWKPASWSSAVGASDRRQRSS